MKQITSLILAGMIGGMLVLGGSFLLTPKHAENTAPSTYGQLVNNNLNVGKLGSTPDGFVRAAEKGMPAVVHITARTKSPANSPTSYERSIEEFFGFGTPMPRQGSGSGVIISEDGYIVTNNHVVEGADEYEVTLYDNRKFQGTLVGVDPNTDIAVLKINSNELPTLKFGNSDKTKVGEWVLAVGNPFDLTSTVTAGIISAKGRNIGILGPQTAIESFIQTDAVVNPGNSGGALMDLEGDLIGINTAIQSSTGVFSGYSFAVPSNIAEKVVDDLIQYGATKRGYLGVNIQDLDSDKAEELGLDIVEGVYVAGLAESGPAIKAGILTGDVIVEVNYNKVRNAPELQEAVGQLRPGDIVSLKLNRKGTVKEFEIQLKELHSN